jgi:hypothetical protein
MPYIGSAVKSINTRSAVDHQQFLGSSADTVTNPGYYTFYVNYSPGNISVFVAGNNISHTDYTANNGTDVRISTSTLTINPADNVEIIGYNIPTSQVLERSDVNITGGSIRNVEISDSNFLGTNNVQFSTGLPVVDSTGNNVISESGGVVTLANNVVPSSSYMFRNKIINGNFDIWQRGTSQTSSGYGSADRWNNTHSGPSSKTASQGVFALGQTDVPDNPKYYLRTVFTSSGGNGDICLTLQNIEDVKTLAGQTAKLSFCARTTGSNKNIATEIIQYFGTGGSPSPSVLSIGTTTHTLTSSWQKFTTTVSIPSISGKTIGTDANDYLGLNFWFEAGANINSSRTNSLGNQSGTFDIAQVQLEEGTVATPFEHRPYGLELSLCQRYAHFIRPASQYAAIGVGRAWSSTQGNAHVYLPVSMRGAIAIEYSNLSHFDLPPAGEGVNGLHNDGSTKQTVKVGWVRNSNVTSGTYYQLEFEDSNWQNAYLGFTSEL